MAIWPFLPSQRKKKEKKKKKKKVEEAATDDEGVIGDCVGNLRATTSTGRRPCFVVFFFFLLFFFCFFFVFWGTCLLLLCFFFFLTNPFVQDLKLLDLLLIFVLLLVLSFLLDLIITSNRCIGQNSPEKLKQKETVRTQKSVMVHRTGWLDRGLCKSLLFLHGTVLHPKQIVKLNGSRFSRSERTVRFGFQNLEAKHLGY